MSCPVRVATPADLDGILEVQRRSPGRSTSAQFRESVGQTIDDATSLVLVAEAPDGPVGWAMTRHFDTPDGLAPAGHYLMGVTVAPAFRRRGIGAALVRERLAWVAGRDAQALFFTNIRNYASIALHERFGFVEVARASHFRGVPFDGGEGVLFRTDLA